MRPAHKRRIGKYSLLLLALLAAGVFVAGCRTNEVAVPPLTGPSGHRLFITMDAAPDHLVIHAPGRPRETSQITLQLKNQQGTGVSGQNIKLRIANSDGSEINIGRLSAYNLTTDSAGFGRVIYTAPDSVEQQSATQIYILAILTDPAYVDEVTDKHMLDLELSAVQPGTCTTSANGPAPAFTINPPSPVVAQEVCFDASTSTGGHALSGFAWTFGDGSSGTGQFACHTYRAVGQFPVTLLVQDVNHNCATLTQSVTIGPGQPASCSIVVSPTPTVVDKTVNFTAIVTDPENGRVRRFVWSFGDGSSTTTSRNTTTHVYKNVGSFTVILTITDDQGNVSTCQSGVTVAAAPTGTPPTCTFSVSPTGVTAGQTVFFNASGSTDADGTIVSYSWDFGDGSAPVTNTTPNTSHAFSPAGTYTVTLTVTDNDGNVTNCQQGVTIAAAPCPTITITAPAALPGGTVATPYPPQTFTATGGNPPYTFASSGTIPPGLGLVAGVLSGTPTTAGTFTFVVTATDSNGCVSAGAAYTVTIAP